MSSSDEMHITIGHSPASDGCGFVGSVKIADHECYRSLRVFNTPGEALQETRLIMVDDVAYFKSDNKYTTVMTAQGESLLRTSLQELLAKLDATHFKQIHRGTIVNRRMVSSIVRDENGRGTMRLKNRPETLQVSLTFMPLFKNM